MSTKQSIKVTQPNVNQHRESCQLSMLLESWKSNPRLKGLNFSLLSNNVEYCMENDSFGIIIMHETSLDDR